MKEENSYESKGGYCAVHTGLLNNGACINSDEHEDILKIVIEKVVEILDYQYHAAYIGEREGLRKAIVDVKFLEKTSAQNIPPKEDKK